MSEVVSEEKETPVKSEAEQAHDNLQFLKSELDAIFNSGEISPGADNARRLIIIIRYIEQGFKALSAAIPAPVAPAAPAAPPV
jgi:hypothetical protein